MSRAAVVLLLGVAAAAAQVKYIGKPGAVQIYGPTVHCTPVERAADKEKVPRLKPGEPNVIFFISGCDVQELQPGPLMATISTDGRVRLEPGYTAEQVLVYVITIWEKGVRIPVK